MKGLFRREKFTGFGPCTLDAPGCERPTSAFRARRGHRLREFVRAHCPRSPGVYGMTDVSGELIYVGKAKSLRSRLMSYFRGESRDEKAAKIIKEARGLRWELASCEFAALLRELELIRRWQPRFNVQGQPRRHRRCYLCIGRPPATHAFVTAKPTRAVLASFGPLTGMGRARDAARKLNDWYRLAECPRKQVMKFAEERELFPVIHTPGCVRHEIGYCVGPCAAACTREQYGFHVQATLDFLHGKDATPLQQLEREMNDAAELELFERAASLRDRLEVLTWLAEQLGRIREAATHSFVYPVDVCTGGQAWFLVRAGLVRAVVAAPADAVSAELALRLLSDVFSNVPLAGAPGLEEVDGVLLVSAWFRKHKPERERVLEIEAARTFARGLLEA